MDNILANNYMPVDDQFLAAMGLKPSQMSSDQKLSVIYDILFTLDKRVAERVVESLNEEQMKQLNALLEKADSEPDLADWMKENIPNYQQILQEEAESMRDEHDRIMKKVMEG